MQKAQFKSTQGGSLKIADQGVQAACMLLLAALFTTDASAQAKANTGINLVAQVTAPPISGGPPPGAGPARQPIIVPPDTGIVPPGSGPRLPPLPAVEPPRGGAGPIQPPPVSPGAILPPPPPPPPPPPGFRRYSW